MATTHEIPEDHYTPAQEKGAGPFEHETELKPDDREDDEEIHDLFSPLPALKGVPEEQSPLTFRAVAVGVVLGTLVNASNVYLGRLTPAMLRILVVRPPWSRYRSTIIIMFTHANRAFIHQVSRPASLSRLTCSAPSSVTLWLC